MSNQRHSPPKMKKAVSFDSRRDGNRWRRRESNKRPVILIAASFGLILLIAISALILIAPNLSGSNPPVTEGIVTTPMANASQQEIRVATPVDITATSESVVSTIYPFDVPSLQQFMFNLVNEARQQNGISLLAWDNLAAQMGTSHAQEMSSYQYLSHLDLDGYGADYRYTQVGGLNLLQENVFSYIHSLGTVPQSIQDWETIIRDAHEKMMQSPEHRSNILNPTHTHLGIGLDYNPTTGRLSIAQEFVDKFVAIQPLPVTALVGQNIELKGKLARGLENPVINLAYEPFPSPKSVNELNNTSTYLSPAQMYQIVALSSDPGGNFASSFSLNHQNQAGLYHIYIRVDDQYGIGRLILDFVVKVSANP